MQTIDLFLLDDHKIVRDGLKSLFSVIPRFKVVGEESNPERFLKDLPKLNFHILILDLSLPNRPGLEVLREVRRLRPEVHVLVLSMHDNPEYMMKAMKEGASGYLSKDIPSEVLVDALTEIQAKGAYYPKELVLSSVPRDALPATQSDLKTLLTSKEREVLLRMVKGLSSKEIAAEFHLSARTIETHRFNLMKKLGTSNSAETIAVAIKLNLIS